MNESTRVVVVTGLSGAGKSTALHALEDLGYFCVDNLPTSLVEQTVTVCEGGGIHRIALGIDVRVGSFLEGVGAALDRIGQGRDVQVLFLDASDESLLRRFNETRRPHPLTAGAAADAGGSRSVAVIDGVQLERARLAPIRARVTLDLDTTLLSVHELRRRVLGYLGPGKQSLPRMNTRFVSFGFKYGAPMDADVVLDVRFLDNPYFVPELRALPGTDAAVRTFVLENPETTAFVEKAADLLRFSLPRYEREGKSYLTVAIGCTGGRHRSVVLAAELAEVIGRLTELPIAVVHRDVARTVTLGEPSSSRAPGSGPGERGGTGAVS
jgi:UPF0042 nucleotide-binding protein